MRQGVIMNETLANVLALYGFERSPFDPQHEFRWADGHTAVYIEREGSLYTVTAYRPYGTQVYHCGPLTAAHAVAFAVAQSAKAARVAVAVL